MIFKTLYKSTTKEFYHYEKLLGEKWEWFTSNSPMLLGETVDIDILKNYYINMIKIENFEVPLDLEIKTLKVNLLD